MKKGKIKRGFSSIYLAILSGIILVILTINGLLEINRTKNGFYRLLEREATVLIQHFEKNILGALSSLQTMESGTGHPLFNPAVSNLFFGLEESIAEYLLEVTHRIDQMDREKALAPPEFQSLMDRYLLSSIEIYDPKGNLLRASPSPSPTPEPFLRDLIEGKRSMVINFLDIPFSEMDRFSIAISRRMAPGIIVLHLEREQMRKLLRQFAIQRAISDIGLREGILFISVQDAHLVTLAHTDSSFIGKREEDLFLKNSLRHRQPFSRIRSSQKEDEIFEVVKSIYLSDQPIGLIRIGYTSKEIRPLLHQIRKNVALSILFFLIFGVSAITLIWANQNRHLKKMREMEDRIQLAERLSSLGHLAAGVAHEIRNPLNAMAMGLQRLKREFLPGEESKKEEYLSFTGLIYREIRRVNEIIEQFLTLSRPFQLNRKETSLKDLLKNLITLFQEEAASDNITLSLEPGPELPLLKIDEEKLTQALINIMKNGIQAMEKGGTLRISTHSFKDRVEVAIMDTGSGISSDQMEKIFNYYYTTKEKGVGLGLPIAHRIIEAHGGQLKVESQVGVGTKVTVALPLKK